MPLDLPSSPRRPSSVQAAIPVAIVSQDPLVGAALRNRLVAAPELWVVSDPTQAAVIIWDPPASSEGELPMLPVEPGSGLAAEPPAVVALTGEDCDPMPLLAAGVCGILRRDADAGRLRASIVAAQHGLNVLDEDPADAIVAAWSPPESPEPEPSRGLHLTPRERQVLEQLADGLSNRAIGEVLGISAHTVKFHVDALLDKLSARSRTQAVVTAIRQGVLAI